MFLVNNIIGFINTIIDGVNTVSGIIGIKVPRLGSVSFGRGGLVKQMQEAIIGEAGPELVVPLKASLGAVDPQIRDVAAFAQSRFSSSGNRYSTPQDFEIGNNKPEQVINVEKGAIVINTLENPENVANTVLNKLVAQVRLG